MEEQNEEESNSENVSQPEIEPKIAGLKSYFQELDRIAQSQETPKKLIQLIDLVARDFLVKKYHVKKASEYDEMSEFFLKKGRPEIATFCHTMVEALYAQESPQKEEVVKIIEELKNVIGKVQEKEPTPLVPKGVFANLNLWKKEKETHTNLGKQTKHLIDTELEEKPIIQQEQQSISEEYQQSILAQAPQAPPPSSNIDHPLIESIDNLERIKYKIQLRKVKPV